MGCCVGENKNINLNKDILVESEEIKKKDEFIKIKDPNTDIQGRQKTDKEEMKKEKSTIDCQNFQKIEKDDSKKEKKEKKEKGVRVHTSSKTAQIANVENNLKVNKNKIIKKGSQRVQHAMNELKLLSLKEINNNKKYFG